MPTRRKQRNADQNLAASAAGDVRHRTDTNRQGARIIVSSSEPIAGEMRQPLGKPIGSGKKSFISRDDRMRCADAHRVQIRTRLEFRCKNIQNILFEFHLSWRSGATRRL